MLLPQILDEPIRRHDLVGVDEQEREHGAQLRTAYLDVPTARTDLQGPEDPELHPSLRRSHREPPAERTTLTGNRPER